MNNPTQVSFESEFAKEVELLFQNNKINTIIETGTFCGDGTTRIVTKCIEKYNREAKFFSIEANINNHRNAINHLRELNLDKYVTLLYGVSVPKSLLPTKEQIDKWVDKYKNEPIYIDHRPEERIQLYYNEPLTSGEEDLLGELIKDNKTDLFVLYSAGHMGYIEFQYVLSQLKNNCFFVLDDVFHIKHYESYHYMEQHPEHFEILKVSHEKFGFLVSKYKI